MSKILVTIAEIGVALNAIVYAYHLLMPVNFHWLYDKQLSTIVTILCAMSLGFILKLIIDYLGKEE